VADARKLPKAKVVELLRRSTDGPDLGILGDPGVNVLMLNIALDKLAPLPPPPAVPQKS
jgi:K+-transporting ATPase ATPase C chain